MTPPTKKRPVSRPTTAVVIGGSLGGLLAASALVGHYDHIIVLDRDRLPDAAAARSGVPHSNQVHGLLARGREAMETLLPGLSAELVELGGELGDFQERTKFYVGDRPLAAGPSGLLALAVSRPLLEHQIRRRVASLPGVTIRQRVTALDLTFDGATGGVCGVVTSDLDADGDEQQMLPADLVLDASGRTARTPEWLERGGYAAPPEDRVRIDVAYTTRTFRRIPNSANVAYLQPVSPGVPRSAVMIAQEDERWTVGLTGYHGERPPRDLGDFIAYAERVPGAIGRMLRDLEPLDDGVTYRFTANVRRRYERLKRLPDGLIVLGDALCAFDPAYGQGMSVAALEALELRDCLTHDVQDLPRTFFARAARHIDSPWMLVVGRDRELPGSTDPAPFATRMINRYVSALLRAATDDAELATMFLRVSHLAAHPRTLMTPRVALRVFIGSRARRPRTDAAAHGQSPHRAPVA